MEQPIYYAIGDIHGELDKLIGLHDLIFETHEKNFSGHKLHIVHLGDYVDRGPKSCETIRYLMAMESTSTRQVTHLKGNHEAMMYEALDENYSEEQSVKALDFWLKHGGMKSMQSYENNNFIVPPSSHLTWIRKLKSYYWDYKARLIFVHAGIDLKEFPNDGSETHLWTRTEKFFNSEAWPDILPEGTKVIHGHTPTKSKKPEVTKDYRRINVDTGACHGGTLSAVILTPEQNPSFLSI